MKELMAKSYEQTQELVNKQNLLDITNFDATADAEKLPYEDKGLYFVQQGKRIIWMKKNDRYCSARYYPSAECASQVIKILKRKGVTTDIEVWKQ